MRGHLWARLNGKSLAELILGKARPRTPALLFLLLPPPPLPSRPLLSLPPLAVPSLSLSLLPSHSAGFPLPCLLCQKSQSLIQETEHFLVSSSQKFSGEEPSLTFFESQVHSWTVTEASALESTRRGECGGGDAATPRASRETPSLRGEGTVS